MNSVLELLVVRRRQRIVRVLIMVGRRLTAGPLRLPRLDQFPPGLFADEGAKSLFDDFRSTPLEPVEVAVVRLGQDARLSLRLGFDGLEVAPLARLQVKAGAQ